MEAPQITSILWATYDALTSPRILKQWYDKDPKFPLCLCPASLKHILVSCKTSLVQGRYTWQHNQVLRCLAATLEIRRTSISALLPTSPCHPARKEFVCEGATLTSGYLGVAEDWSFLVDSNKKLHFPLEITNTNPGPDLVLWSSSLCRVYITELTAPWEDAVEEVYERKSLK